jgi:rhodanese-related sulfurtransferase
LKRSSLAWLFVWSVWATPAWCNITAMVALEPTSGKFGVMPSRAGIETNLTKWLGQTVTVTNSEDLSDAMRATRSGGYDVFIAPAQVAASAMAHGYELVGSTDAEEQYLLVGRSNLGSVAELRRGRLYLPQQDSLYTYLARGMLTANGLSFKDLDKVEYARYAQAGLSAIGVRNSDATVIRREDWESWQKEHGHMASTKVLATSGAVPGGLSVVVKKSLSPQVRGQVAQWFSASASTSGMKLVAHRSESALYKKIAELGTFTPTTWPGMKVVASEEVKSLMAQGAVVVDTRTEKEFKQRHIPGAVHVAYVEKSLKDVVYDGTVDDFAGLKALDSKKPTIFHCNGAECWKSYKASRAALAAGFAQVYWYRGGLPDWEAAGQKVAEK